MNKVPFLKNIFSEKNFTKIEQEKIINSFEKKTFSKDHLLFQKDQYLRHYYILEKGFVRSYVIDYNGKDTTTEFFSSKNIVIDWPAFFLKTPSNENFQTTTDCICWKISYDDFQILFHEIKNFREAGRKRLTEDYLQLKEKNLILITEKAKERYLDLLQKRPEIIQNNSLKHIATYLGITDTSLSRIRKEISFE